MRERKQTNIAKCEAKIASSPGPAQPQGLYECQQPSCFQPGHPDPWPSSTGTPVLRFHWHLTWKTSCLTHPPSRGPMGSQAKPMRTKVWCAVQAPAGTTLPHLGNRNYTPAMHPGPESVVRVKTAPSYPLGKSQLRQHPFRPQKDVFPEPGPPRML